jgi:NAD(P)-dependent dehydrogenase (short-subunit alcohol dehydrogenase family)
MLIPMNEQNTSIFSVQDKIIVIVGATGILGSKYLEFLAKHGAIVIAGDVDIEKCKSLTGKLNKKGLKTFPLFIDNTDEESITLFFEQIRSTFGKLDVLINNAQIKPQGFYAPFELYSKETLLKVIDGNLIGVTLSCQEACKIFLLQGYGVIINVASIYGIVAADQRLYDGVDNIYFADEKFSSPVSYAISKAGIVQLTKYLASYYREKAIRVNCLTPGGVFDNHDDRFNRQYSYRTLLGRMADKNEYNGAILFLASDASSYMTGFNLVIDGGWSVI